MSWPSHRVGFLLEAERRGNIKEVEGGWIVLGFFMRKFPFTGEALDSYLEWLSQEPHGI